jgi:hypothetical protein
MNTNQREKRKADKRFSYRSSRRFYYDNPLDSDLNLMANRFGVVCVGAPARAPGSHGQHLPGSMGLIYETFKFCMLLNVHESARFVPDSPDWWIDATSPAAKAELEKRIKVALAAGFIQADMPHLFIWEKTDERLTRIALKLIGARFI